MRNTKLLTALAAAALILGGCGKREDHSGTPLVVSDNPQPSAHQMVPPAQAVPQQAPPPAQADSGPGWGGALAAGALGYMLGSSGSSSQTRVVEREIRYVDRPVQIAPKAPAAPSGGWFSRKPTTPAPAAPQAAPKPAPAPAAAPQPQVRRLPGAGSSPTSSRPSFSRPSSSRSFSRR